MPSWWDGRAARPPVRETLFADGAADESRYVVYVKTSEPYPTYTDMGNVDPSAVSYYNLTASSATKAGRVADAAYPYMWSSFGRGAVAYSVWAGYED